MNIIEVVRTASEAETEAFGERVARNLNGRRVILLRGNLGAGKTVFARGFARGLGITEVVNSPTYTIVQEYPMPAGGRFYHLDLYRISGAASALDFGVDEFFAERGSISLVEWPERIESLLPDDALVIELDHLGEHERELKVLSR